TPRRRSPAAPPRGWTTSPRSPRTSRGSRSAGSTRATSTKRSRTARRGSASCARSPRPRTPRPPRGRWRRHLSRGPDYSRSKARAGASRRGLEPLGPDERPLGLKLAIALALVLGGANVVATAAAAEWPFAIVIALFTGFIVYGLWTRQYLAILLFQ